MLIIEMIVILFACFIALLVYLYPLFRLLKFVYVNMNHFDDSHNHIHAFIVLYHSLKIVLMKYIKNQTNAYYEIDIWFVITTALLHDICDHKYISQWRVNEDELKKFIVSIYEQKANLIITAINNISFSKQKHGKRIKMDPISELCRNIVSDADKIEALNLNRCYIFSTAYNPDKSDEEIFKIVCKHYHEKLSILLPQKYIETEEGRIIAKPYHDAMVKDFENNYKKYE